MMLRNTTDDDKKRIKHRPSFLSTACLQETDVCFQCQIRSCFANRDFLEKMTNFTTLAPKAPKASAQ